MSADAPVATATASPSAPSEAEMEALEAALRDALFEAQFICLVAERELAQLLKGHPRGFRPADDPVTARAEARCEAQRASALAAYSAWEDVASRAWPVVVDDLGLSPGQDRILKLSCGHTFADGTLDHDGAPPGTYNGARQYCLECDDGDGEAA